MRSLLITGSAGADFRDWLQEDDHCRAIDQRFAADGALAGHFPRCPAANGQNCAELITCVKDCPGHDRLYAIDSGRAQQELGYAPPCTLATGINATIDWYLADETCWRAALNVSYVDGLTSNYANRG